MSTGMGEAPDPSRPSPPPSAWVRYVNASPDPALADVSVFVDPTRDEAAVSALHTGTLEGRFPSGSGPVHVVVRAGNSGVTGPALVEAQRQLASGQPHTLIVHGVRDGHPAASVATLQDDLTPAPAGSVRVRLFHAVAGLEGVDVCMLQGQGARLRRVLLWRNAQYGRVASAAHDAHGEYVTVPADAPARIGVYMHTGRACSLRQQGEVQLPATRSGAVLDAVLMGRAGAPRMLVCDSPESFSAVASCAVVPLAPPGGRARSRDR